MTEADIEASKAPLLDHLIELRARLIRALIAFAVMFLVCFYFSKDIYNVLVWPFANAAKSLGLHDVRLIYTAPLEFFFTQIQVAVFGAAFFAFPIIAQQIYKFVAPGLYKNERDAFLPYLIATPVFFLFGALVVYFLAMPLLMKFSLGMQQLGPDVAKIELLPKVSDYLSLIMTLVFAFGVCFQLPVILALLGQAGIIDSKFLVEKRRYAIVILCAAAAILTPPDAVSMLVLAVPTVLLYEASIVAVKYFEKRKAAAKAAAEAAEGA